MSNIERVTQTVDTKEVDKLARILGTFDENLNFLCRELGVVGYVEGAKIRLEGIEAPEHRRSTRDNGKER